MRTTAEIYAKGVKKGQQEAKATENQHRDYEMRFGPPGTEAAMEEHMRWRDAAAGLVGGYDAIKEEILRQIPGTTVNFRYDGEDGIYTFVFPSKERIEVSMFDIGQLLEKLAKTNFRDPGTTPQLTGLDY